MASSSPGVSQGKNLTPVTLFLVLSCSSTPPPPYSVPSSCPSVLWQSFGHQNLLRPPAQWPVGNGPRKSSLSPGQARTCSFRPWHLSGLQSEVTLRLVVKMRLTGSRSPCPWGLQALSPQLLFLHTVQVFTWLPSKADSAQNPHAWLKIAALRRGLWRGAAV